MADYPLRPAVLSNEAASYGRGRVATAPAKPFARFEEVADDADAASVSRTPRRPASVLVLGFLLTVGGAVVIAQSTPQWRTMVTGWSENVAALAKLFGWTTAVDALHLRPGAVLFEPRTQTLVGAGAVVLGGAALGAGFFPALFSAALVAAVGWCLSTLTGVTISPAWIGILAAAIAYLFHAPAGTRGLASRGVVGTLLILTAGLAARFGWMRWTVLAERIGGNATEFFAAWGDVCTWGLVLAVTAVGVAIARQRRLRFVNAALLCALAWQCITSGMSKWVYFPTLGASGKSIETIEMANVPVWRWVIAGELVLLVWVLLYQTRGFGMLNFAFALLWLVGGIAVSKQVGTLSAARALGEVMSMAAATAATPAASSTGFGNIGLPTGSLAPGSTAPRLQGGEVRNSGVSNASKSNAMLVTGIYRETTVLVWLLLIAILAGLIAVAGLAWMSPDPTYRRIAILALWSSVALAGGWLWAQAPRASDQPWLSWLGDWTQPRNARFAVSFISLVTAALTGPFALSRSASVSAWRMVSILSVFFGTGLSLVAVTMLIRMGGFSPLPTWTYVAIAAGQSSLAWLLMMATTSHPTAPILRTQPIRQAARA